MIAASLSGYLLSVPFLRADGEERVYAATLPVLGVFLSLGICCWRRSADRPPANMRAGEASRGGWPLAVAGAALVAVAMAGPALAIRAAKAPPSFALPDPSGGDFAVIRSDGPRITVLKPGDPESTFVPRVTRIDYLRNLPAFAKEDFRLVPLPGVVYYARNLLARNAPGVAEEYIWVVGPEALVGDKPRYRLLRGSYRKETNVFRVSGFSDLGDAAD